LSAANVQGVWGFCKVFLQIIKTSHRSPFQRNIALYFAETAYVCIISAKYIKWGEKIIGRKSEVLLLKQLIASPKALSSQT
jgi:hypothetical protein